MRRACGQPTRGCVYTRYTTPFGCVSYVILRWFVVVGSVSACWCLSVCFRFYFFEWVESVPIVVVRGVRVTKNTHETTASRVHTLLCYPPPLTLLCCILFCLIYIYTKYIYIPLLFPPSSPPSHAPIFALFLSSSPPRARAVLLCSFRGNVCTCVFLSFSPSIRWGAVRCGGNALAGRTSGSAGGHREGRGGGSGSRVWIASRRTGGAASRGHGRWGGGPGVLVGGWLWCGGGDVVFWVWFGSASG